MIIQGCISLACCVDTGANGAQTVVGKELLLRSDQGQASTVLADVILPTANSQFNKTKKLKNIFDETLNMILFNLTLECISLNILGVYKAILLPTNVIAVLRENHPCR